MQVTPDRASRTLVSEPPYESARLIGTAAPPPVGAIVIVAGDDPSGTLLDCLAHQRAFPWCPACIACSDLVREPQGVRALEPRPGLTALVPTDHGNVDDRCGGCCAIGCRLSGGRRRIATGQDKRGHQDDDG